MSKTKKPAETETIWTVAEVWDRVRGEYVPTLVGATARRRRSSAWRLSDRLSGPEAAIDAWRADVERRIADARAEVRRLERLATEPVREPASTPACDAPVSRVESVAGPNRWLSIAERIADQFSGWKP